MKRGRTPGAIVFGIALWMALSSAIAAKPATELSRAVAAAEKARGTPKGAAYQQAAMSVFGNVIAAAIKDCGVMNAPGVRFRGFQAVLIISSSGKLKWVIRDPNNPLSNCFLSKTVGMTFPVPPGDNWPVLFQIN